MSKHEKMIEKILSGKSDGNIGFEEMCSLLIRLGFTQRQRGGSHAIFQDGAFFVNLQNFGGKVKSYQVRQVREVLRQRNQG